MSNKTPSGKCMEKRTNTSWFFYLLFCASLALTWFFNRDLSRFDDPRGVWSDRAGYYIYLPALFYYHFDTRSMPADLDIRTGGGFAIDTTRNKIDIKYTYGVALMQSPAFFFSRLISRATGYDDQDGFSMIFVRMLQLSGVIWFILGLWFLKRFLDRYFIGWISMATMVILFAGTHLFYYVILDGMMSHVYSFFLFALFLDQFRQYNDRPGRTRFVILCLILGLIILIRPTNALLVSLLFFWDAPNGREVIRRFREFFRPLNLLIFAGILFLIFLPQMIYWDYLSGSWIHFSYQGEGFVNWRHPRIGAVLFSPVNGLFTNSPVMLFCIAGIIYMIVTKQKNGTLIAVLFAMVTLFSATWKMWYFGCSFGQRNYIEYLTILAVPFGSLLSRITGKPNANSTSLDTGDISGNPTDKVPGRGGMPVRINGMMRFIMLSLFFFLLFFSVYFNLRYIISLYRFERCYYGSTWDWDHYLKSLERAGIIQPSHPIRSFINDFENLSLCPVYKPSPVFTRSGQYSVATEKYSTLTPLYSLSTGLLGQPVPKRLICSLWLLKPGNRPTGAFLTYQFRRDTTMVFSDRVPVDSVLTGPLTWNRLSATFIIPDLNDSIQQVRIFIENPRRALIYADDLAIRFRYDWNE